METEYVVKRIRSMAGTKFDPKVVAALETLFQAGKIRPRRTVPIQPENAVPPMAVAAAAASATQASDVRERV